jgi:hypothetical protein
MNRNQEKNCICIHGDQCNMDSSDGIREFRIRAVWFWPSWRASEVGTVRSLVKSQSPLM